MERMIERDRLRPLKHLLFIIVSACCVAPLLLILSASLSDQILLKKLGYSLIPRGFTLQAYKYIAQSPGALIRAYGVTISVTLIGTFISLLITSMLGYVITRRDFRLARPLSFLVLFAMLFSAGMVPTYITMTQVYHMKDSLRALIFPLLIQSWNVFLMKSFLRNTSMDLVDAAKIDGAGEIGIFFRIVLPLAKPAMATVGLFTAFSYWNDWFQSMLYVDNGKLTSLQYYMYRLMNNISFLSNSMYAGNIDFSKMPSETVRMALCVLAAGPMLIIFPFFQRYFVRGLNVGAVKE